MTGIVKSYSRKHGYGFIEAGGEDVFFHVADWDLPESPRPGIRVRADIKVTKKGVRAINIRRE